MPAAKPPEALGVASKPSARPPRQKAKTCLADYNAELRREIEEEHAAAEAAALAAKARSKGSAPTDRQGSFKRSLQREQLMPLVDLAFSESPSVQGSAIGLLATLSINADNKDVLMAAGSLKPLLACCAEGMDLIVRRQALSGLAHMTVREDIRHILCAVPGGLRACVQGVWCRDIQARLAAAECVANVASSMKLRGQLLAANVLPALSSLLVAKAPELKRLGMLALQRLATEQQARVTKEDPEGDGFAGEIMAQGVLTPLLALLRGGPTIEETLRTQAMRTVYEMASSSHEVKLRLCAEHAELVRVVVGLLLLDDHPGGATQREACRVVQLLASHQVNLMVLVHSGLLAALAVLGKSESTIKKHASAVLLGQLAVDPECRRHLLKSGGAKTLCLLSRTLARKVVRPALTALCSMSTHASCVTGLLDAGAGRVLSSLASSSDPEMREMGCTALANMLSAVADEDRLHVTDQLLHQGALPVFFAASYSRDLPTQLAASRGLTSFAACSPTHARIIARKGAARPLSALVHGRDRVLANAIDAIHDVAHALTSMQEPLKKKNLARVRGVLEVAVVGTAKELWARLNEDEGRPASRIMSIARSHEQLKQKAQEILRMLKPDALGLVEEDMPEKTGYAPEAIAKRHCRLLSVVRIQKRFVHMRKELRSRKLAADPAAAERRVRLGFTDAPTTPAHRPAPNRRSGNGRGLPIRELNRLNEAVSAGVGGEAFTGDAPAALVSSGISARQAARFAWQADSPAAAAGAPAPMSATPRRVSLLGGAPEAARSPPSKRRWSTVDAGKYGGGKALVEPLVVLSARAPPSTPVEAPRTSLSAALNLPGSSPTTSRALKGCAASAGATELSTPRPPPTRNAPTRTPAPTFARTIQSANR